MTTFCRIFAAMAALFLCAWLAIAQETPASKQETPAKKKSTSRVIDNQSIEKQKKSEAEKKADTANAAPAAQSMEMPKPAPEITKLIKMFSGTWNATEKHEVSDFMPKGGTGKGVDIVKAGPGGNSLLGDYRSTGAMGRFSGHGIIYWDAKKQAYSSIWCDSMSPSCETSATGKWEGNDLVFRAEEEMMGKKMAMRQVYTDIKPDSYTFYIDVSMDGGPMKRDMTIHYVKATPKAATPNKQ